MGVVHHSHYPVYFEQGRTEYFQEHLRPYQEFEAEGLLAPVTSYQVHLKGRLGYGDTLRLETFAVRFKGLRVIMGYRGFNGEELVVEGESVHALTDPSLKALHPRHLPESYQYLKKRFRELLPVGKS
jgi:acyl-CoA thioester hydrolase